MLGVRLATDDGFMHFFNGKLRMIRTAPLAVE
jgi:hypothetical protein